MPTEPSPTSLIATNDTVDERDAGPEADVGTGLDVEATVEEAPGAEPSNGERAPHGWRGRRGRRLLYGLAAVVLLLAGYYLFNLWHVWATGRSDQARSVDAIVVMGAAQYDGRPSNQLAARLDHVVELWPEGHAPIVVVTGGNQPGDRFTEAEASASYLVDRGVPESAILLENEGSNTFESLEAVDEILAGHVDGADDGVTSVLIVTDPYHALRSRLIAQELGLTAYVSSTDTSVVTGGPSFRRHLQEAAGISVGRIIGFERLSGLTG